MPKNQLPIGRVEINHLAQIYGEEIAENVRLVAQEARRQGGINPTGVELILPEGPNGNLCEHELFRIVGNLATWWAYEAD